MAAANIAVNEVEADAWSARRGQEQFVSERRMLEWPDGTVSATVEFLHALYRRVTTVNRHLVVRLWIFIQRIGARLEAVYGDSDRPRSRPNSRHISSRHATPREPSS